MSAVENGLVVGAQDEYDRLHAEPKWIGEVFAGSPALEDFIHAAEMEEDFLDLMFVDPSVIYSYVRNGIDRAEWDKKVYKFVTAYRWEDFTSYMNELYGGDES